MGYKGLRIEDDMEELQKENRRLNKLAETDWLTGVYNRGAVENKVNELIDKEKNGVMLVLDVDRFKEINDMFGHIVGDQFLKDLARLLKMMFFKNDIIGRVGGDEFVVFIPVKQDMDFAEERCAQIKKRFSSSSSYKNVSLTMGGTVYQEGDDYLSMFDRADQIMIGEKKRKKLMDVAGSGSVKAQIPGMDIDMRLISAELRKNNQTQGAFCQDYEVFKSIYCFTERRLRRTKGNACIILFTITDGENHFPRFAVREAQMEILSEIIQNCLRAGDVYTQYSSCQFLTMVSDASMENIDCIAERICSCFYKRVPGGQNNCLLHHGYPMGAEEAN
ncbi:diguanylate cyclase [Clostridium sp. MCC353]|uniref:GGDEF domain-containing protein n=1 Tax=Clostridium sp. MCC353 TaxID=2592646 RepID=UPI001C01E046|nr:GGDEF domain-containing protein [Clostridium sp. MCC353]MBT9779109.1 diguanylate cyclase [Clostridium sp. MCC353]